MDSGELGGRVRTRGLSMRGRRVLHRLEELFVSADPKVLCEQTARVRRCAQLRPWRRLGREELRAELPQVASLSRRRSGLFPFSNFVCHFVRHFAFLEAQIRKARLLVHAQVQ